jgi:hypothetical protein
MPPQLILLKVQADKTATNVMPVNRVGDLEIVNSHSRIDFYTKIFCLIYFYMKIFKFKLFHLQLNFDHL